ncbi:helix-turn-helix domain-containing protein [Oscillibacter ruminantium]|uniref:helix-turn-helix domain-containing protein n=1 Tax=Oscillibacter ruminantium TaxID=1263547 RepID=UPI0002F09A0C|nr:helix-turn-helix transcriptional regulator [Oscillibacter ruminantium]
MPAQWTADVIGKMHMLRISNKQLAEKLGVTPEYVSMILNGHRDPEGANQRFLEAVNEMASENMRKVDSQSE